MHYELLDRLTLCERIPSFVARRGLDSVSSITTVMPPRRRNCVETLLKRILPIRGLDVSALVPSARYSASPPRRAWFPQSPNRYPLCAAPILFAVVSPKNAHEGFVFVRRYYYYIERASEVGVVMPDGFH